MALNTSLKSVSLGTAVLGALFSGAATFAQCDTSATPNFTQNDTGCPVTGVADTNGGCNVAPVAFQATGNLSVANPSFIIGGTCGQDPVANSRDIDWYSFTVTDACFVTLSATMTDPTGAAAPANTILIFSGRFNTDGTPNCDSVAGYSFATCPGVYPEFFAEPGTYMAIVTTQFASGGGLVCESPYRMTVSARFTQFASCGSPSSGTCGVATPAVGGCQDVSCCDRICTANPLCCDIEWDASCATLAQQPTTAGGCGVFVYNCTPSGPANNCATASETVALNAVTPFDNALATNDGPNNGQCGAITKKDVWFAVLATANGNMTLNCNSPGQDVVLSAYDFGTAGAPFDGTQLANNFVGCLDNAGIGGEIATINGALAGHWYLWRVGEWDDATNTGTAGAGTIEITLEQVVYDSGIHQAVCTPAGAATNLGLSSGAIAAGSPQRWLAAPFTVSDPTGAPDSWNVTQFIPEGFIPAGSVNTNLNWILLRRTGSNAPSYATDQIASGQIAFPGTLGANGEAYIPVNLALDPGDYYFTMFASAPGNPCRANDGQTVLSNFAWFIGAPNGVAFPDPAVPGGFFQYRSSVQPGSGPANEVVIAGTTSECEGGTAPAWPKYTALNGAYQNCTAGGSMLPVYSPALHILGTPNLANNCPADLNGDGSVGSADLSILLGGWGTASPDLNNDGVVGSADLSVLLGAWGACP